MHTQHFVDAFLGTAKLSSCPLKPGTKISINCSFTCQEGQARQALAPWAAAQGCGLLMILAAVSYLLGQFLPKQFSLANQVGKQ